MNKIKQKEATERMEYFIFLICGEADDAMPRTGVTFLCLLVMSLCLNEIRGQTSCTQSNSCACNMDDGSGVIDLSSIAKNDGTAA